MLHSLILSYIQAQTFSDYRLLNTIMILMASTLQVFGLPPCPWTDTHPDSPTQTHSRALDTPNNAPTRPSFHPSIRPSVHPSIHPSSHPSWHCLTNKRRKLCTGVGLYIPRALIQQIWIVKHLDVLNARRHNTKYILCIMCECVRLYSMNTLYNAFWKRRYYKQCFDTAMLFFSCWPHVRPGMVSLLCRYNRPTTACLKVTQITIFRLI